jgi:hypothetical protein
MLNTPGLSDSERAYVQYLVSKYSKELGRAESAMKKAAQAFFTLVFLRP